MAGLAALRGPRRGEQSPLGLCRGRGDDPGAQAASPEEPRPAPRHGAEGQSGRRRTAPPSTTSAATPPVEMGHAEEEAALLPGHGVPG